MRCELFIMNYDTHYNYTYNGESKRSMMKNVTIIITIPLYYTLLQTLPIIFMYLYFLLCVMC